MATRALQLTPRKGTYLTDGVILYEVVRVLSDGALSVVNVKTEDVDILVPKEYCGMREVCPGK
jgi:hypothetical protein